jgi:hypothetical protein
MFHVVDVDEVCAAIIDVLLEKHAAMGTREARHDADHVVSGVRRRKLGEALRRERVVPKGTASSLEPRVVGPESARALLKTLAHASSLGGEVEIRRP